MKKVMLFVGLSFCLTACFKDPFATTNNTNTNTTPTTPNACPGADGSVWAVKSVTTKSTAPGFPAATIVLGTGVGVFSSNGLSSSGMNRVNVGTVKLNSKTMDYQGETYIATASQTDPTGIDFSSGVTWEVSGGNGFGAFTYTPTNTFPSATSITSSSTVTKSAGYTLTCNTVTGADSVLFLVGDVPKTLGGNATSCNFTSAELSGLSNGTQLVQIVPYSMVSAVVGGKNICFGKEMVQQLTVTVQ